MDENSLEKLTQESMSQTPIHIVTAEVKDNRFNIDSDCEVKRFGNEITNITLNNQHIAKTIKMQKVKLKQGGNKCLSSKYFNR